MIISKMKDGQGMHIEGDIAEVSAECILIMRQIYKRNKEQMGEAIAQGILTNMLIKAVVEDLTKEEYINWQMSQEQKDAYAD